LRKNKIKMKPSRLKVAVISISLARGGAEKSTALLTKVLDALDYEVHLITITNQIEYAFAGKLFNLGERKKPNDNPVKQWSHLKALRNYLLENQINVVIDNRTRNRFFKELIYTYYAYSGFKVVYVVRSAFIRNYFPKSNWLTRKMIHKSSKIVGVSNAISEQINREFNTNKAITIFNAVEVDNSPINLNPKDYVVFVGRIDNEAKDFLLLLNAYSNSSLPAQGIELRIYGNGPDKSWLKQQIKALDLWNVVKLFEFTSEVDDVMRNAKFLILTSNYEGFPRVLIESLSVGTPVISVDCETGPNEIIVNENNGLLVENDNIMALANAFNRFIFEPELYKLCKSNAQKSIQQFTTQPIAIQWQQLLNQI
jgi:glycosyltransferase involved in cell wall biosynthesis